MRLLTSAQIMVTASLLLLPLSGSSQKKVDSPPPQTVIRATTRLVEVTVVVQDKNGNPITGLQQRDFVLTDEGKPQAIALFAMEDARTLAAAPPAPRPLPPNTFVNRPTQRAGVLPGATVVLIDGLNTPLGNRARVRENMLKFLKQLQPDEPVALYALDSKLRLLQEFTEDPALLIRAFEQYKDRPSAHRTEFQPQQAVAAGGPFEQSVRISNAFEQRAADFSMEQTVRGTVEAMQAIAHHLAGVHGRKSLVWLSGSFPITAGMDTCQFSPGMFEECGELLVKQSESDRLSSLPRENRNFVPLIERAARALSDSDLAVYPVDARGALDVWTIDPTLNRPNARIQGGLEKGELQPPERVHGKEDTMYALAEQTGGRAFNNHDLATAVRRAVDDGRVTYTLAYYPNHGQWDGKFRRIKVEVRRPGVHLFYRRGYFATGTAALPPNERTNLLAEELLNPLDASRLALAAHTDVTEAAGKKYIQAEVQFSPRDVTFVPAAEGWSAAVDLLFVEMKENGQILVSAKGTLDLTVKEQDRKAQQERPFRFPQRLELIPGAHRLKVIALDAMSGAVGSLTIPLAQVSAAQP